MKTFIFYGHTAQPGVAGSLVALAVVRARDIASAGRKLKGKICEGRRTPEDGRWFRPGAGAEPVLRRFVTAQLRAMTGRAPKDYEIAQHRQRYTSFRIERMPFMR